MSNGLEWEIYDRNGLIAEKNQALMEVSKRSKVPTVLNFMSETGANYFVAARNVYTDRDGVARGYQAVRSILDEDFRVRQEIQEDISSILDEG